MIIFLLFGPNLFWGREVSEGGELLQGARHASPCGRKLGITARIDTWFGCLFLKRIIRKLS